MFTLKAPFSPAGDQPKAIAQLTEGIIRGLDHQVLVGVTGSGKTFTVANVIQNTSLPTLVISHNKTLAAQLYQELKAFFPDNAVHYFVSYYDYYQPEAYIPQSDTYIEKDAKINEELDRMRHAATQAIFSRNDVIVVASVSCIYNIGSPEEYKNLALILAKGQVLAQRELLDHLVDLQYVRNDIDTLPGSFRVRGDRIEITPSTGSEVLAVEFAKKSVRSLSRRSGLGIADPEQPIEKAVVFPAKFWVAPRDKVNLALANIEAELATRLATLHGKGKLLEAERLLQRTRNDLAAMRETGYCHGIENYSRHLEFRNPGDPPFSLLDHLSAAYDSGRNGKHRGWLTVIDESHMTIPQLHGMFHGDKSRKETLVDYGFRLPSALDNRPLRFSEFSERVGALIYMSATPGIYELQKAKVAARAIERPPHGGAVEQIVRPTGLLDPTIEIRETKNQVPYLIRRIQERKAKSQRVLVLTLTKRLAEDLASYLGEQGISAHYLHSEIKTLERPGRIAELRAGAVDVIVGINLLREGIDIPELGLVAILDADKEGFLRNDTSLIQMMGRASRHVEGHVILFADHVTQSMQRAIEETERRRTIQRAFNTERGITPKSIEKPLERPRLIEAIPEEAENLPLGKTDPELIKTLKRQMREFAKNLEFEKAAKTRDLLRKLTGS